ncbi:hypothetical protein F5Y08DRAFT_12416 [Xylaria arbuscula]|nr:hypothetical protein F5Y08DRAFT_12416 [Xylaria arbuscula]
MCPMCVCVYVCVLLTRCFHSHLLLCISCMTKPPPIPNPKSCPPKTAMRARRSNSSSTIPGQHSRVRLASTHVIDQHHHHHQIVVFYRPRRACCVAAAVPLFAQRTPITLGA